MKPNNIKTIVLALASIGLVSLPARMAFANPVDGKVAAGNVTIQQESATKLGITQTSNKAIVDWKSFSIGANEHTQFYQPSASAVILNRVVGEDPSQILGRLTANGQIFLVNPNGIYFGKNAQIDVASLVASTHNIRNEDFLAGNYAFTIPGKPGASVINEGTIRIADTGIAAFVAPSVANRGVIVAKLGKVMLASANGFTLDFQGDQLLSFLVSDEVAQTAFDLNGKPLTSFVENSGRIEAQGGYVLLTAKAAEGAIHSVINQSGSIEATSVGQQNGEIVLRGDFVALGGTISADGVGLGSKGGTIRVTASGDLSLADSVSARSATSTGGNISYSAGGRIFESATSHTDASGQTDGGTIRVVADGGILSSGTYSATGATGQGGRIDLAGGSVRLLSATLDASGATQGGLVRVGGAFQGGKAQDPTSDTWRRYIGRYGSLPDLPNAELTFINDSSRIDVSSKVGAGGTAVVWSGTQTTFLGSISAKGGAVEVSSAGDLRYVNLIGLDLGTGFLLLDPKNIVIGDSPTAGTWTYQAILGKGYSGGKNLDVSSLDAGDWFGQYVALNAAGDRLAVGSSQDDGFGNIAANSGAVRLFSFTDTNFSGGALQATMGKGYTGGKNINVSSLEVGDGFGSSVALNAVGDRLAVGTWLDDGSGNSVANSGAVHLFSFTDTSFSGGVLQATLGKGYTGGKNVDVSSLESNDGFGSSISLNAAGDRLAVGAWRDAGSGNIAPVSGAVRLFSFSDTSFSGGALQATLGKGYTGGKNLDMSNLESGDQFGRAVALNAAGDRLAVGAYGDQGIANSASQLGAVYLFSFADTNFSGGALQAMLGKGYSGGKNIDMTSLAAGDSFGFSVALNGAGDRLAVGAFGDDGASNSVTDAGAVYLFSFTDTNFSGGALQATVGKGYSGGKNVDVASLEANDWFSSSVALNAAGDRLAVGAGGEAGNGNIAAQSGAVYLFSNLPSNSVNFASNSGTTQNIDRAGLQTLLSAGTSVTLQASNDITWNSGSNLVVNNLYGNGGALTLQAGRSVLINSSIATDNGNLAVTANSSLADGVVNADRDFGAANITMASGTVINAGTGLISLGIGTGAGLTNNTGGNISLEGLTGGTVVLRNQGGGSIAANGAVVASSLDLSGTGVTATFTNSGNTVGTLSANIGSLNFVNSGALTIGSGAYATGIAATGLVNVATLSGDLTIGQNVSTSNTSSAAIVLNAGQSAAAGMATGGNIVLSGNPTITVGAGGTAKLYSGSSAGSTGLSALVGAGSSRVSYNSDEASGNFSPVLGSGLYVIYREQGNSTLLMGTSDFINHVTLPVTAGSTAAVSSISGGHFDLIAAGENVDIANSVINAYKAVSSGQVQVMTNGIDASFLPYVILRAIVITLDSKEVLAAKNDIDYANAVSKGVRDVLATLGALDGAIVGSYVGASAGGGVVFLTGGTGVIAVPALTYAGQISGAIDGAVLAEFVYDKAYKDKVEQFASAKYQQIIQSMSSK
jgi:filamentous hemagglutinin family protein